jgi:hypothetical protein
MSLSYINSIKDARMTAVITGIDNNVAVATLEIATIGYASVLVVIPLAKPSFTESAQAITMASAPRSGIAANTGTAAVARIKDGGGNVQVNNLSVGTTGSDINLNSTSISAGQTVTLSSGLISHAP